MHIIDARSPDHSLSRRARRAWIAPLLGALALAMPQAPALAQSAEAGSAGTIEADGTVVVPSFRLPPSVYLSDEAKAALPRKPTDPEEIMYKALAAGKAGEMRARVSEAVAPRVKHLTQPRARRWIVVRRRHQNVYARVVIEQHRNHTSQHSDHDANNFLQTAVCIQHVAVRRGDAVVRIVVHQISKLRQDGHVRFRRHADRELRPLL